MPDRLASFPISNPAADAEVFLQGAHLTSWIPRGRKPVLFTSAHSFYEPGKPIRGGVPIIFPWFGPRHDGLPGPAHGLARTALWRVVSEAPELTLALEIEQAELEFRIDAGESLHMSLTVRNLASQPLVFENALHTYFAVADVRRISIS
ncbi:MAG: D-hexose-6-phosphate mutarotase, partial [Terriglobia bacterium]